MRRGPIELLGIIKRCCFLLILGYWFCSTVPVVSVGVSTDTEEIYHTSHSHLRSEISANKALVESVNIGADVIDHTNDPKRGKTIDDVPHDKLGHGHLHRITNTHTLIAGKHYNIEDGIHESKDKGVDSVTSPNGGFKFVESVESGDGGFNYEQSKQISPDITGSIATKTSTLGDSLNRLKKLKYDTAADPAVVLHSVKSIAQSQKNTRDGNKEEVGLALKSIVETGNPFAKTTKDIQASDAVDISALIDENSLSLDSITKQQLAQYFPAQVIDEIVEQTQHADTVHRNLRDWTGRNVRKGTGEKKGQHDEVFAWSDDELTPLDDGTHHGLPASLNDRGVITVGDNMKRLAKLQRSGLRGFDGMDPAEVVSEVKQVLAEHLNNIIPLHQHIRNNNREEAGSEIKSMVDDASMLVDMSIELQEEKKLSSPGNSFSFDDVANDQLAQFIPAELFDNLVQHTQDIHDMLDETDLSTLSAPHSHRPLKRDRFEPQESGHVDSLFEFIGHPTFIQSVPNGKLHPNNFFTDPSSVKKFLHLNRASSGSMPKLGKYTNFHNNDIIMSKHQLRLDALGNICAHSCKLENSTCLCSRLFDCVRNMTEYDLAVIIAGGFIDTNPSSNTFGNFSVPANQLNLYNADQGVAAKLSTLKSKALGNSANTQNCNAVLGELFSACDPDESTCTNPNVQSFAVSTQEVCDVVNSNKKLLFEVIGEEFDGLADKFAKAPCKPLSYDVCAEFLVQFDMLYLGRDTGGYPLSNPMLKNPSNTVHDQGGNNKVVFDRVQFPIRYNFKQHQNTGVVMRVFSGDSTSAGPQYFYLTNPLTGKVLGLSRGSCADLTRIEVQLRIYDNGNIDSQQFSLTNDGRLESKACSNKVLSNNWNVGGIHSCRHGNELVLRPIITTDADLQRWTFVRDGSGIVNSRCGKWSGNLAISAIEDDSITKIDYTDTIPVQFINPETNMAIGLESGTCVNGRKVKLQTENGGSDQMFYLKRISDGSGEWYIESKTCDGKVLEIVGIGCGTAAEVQLYSDAFLRHTMVGECKDAQNRKYHRVRTSSNYGWDGTQIGCLNFCEDLPGFDDQVAFETWSSTQNWDTVYCYCMYDSGTVPSGTDLPTSATPITHHISPGSGPVAHGSGFSHLSCFPYNNDKRNHWKLEDGKLKSAKCKDMVMEIQSTSTLDGSGIVLAPDIEWGWNQAWSIKSNAARLLTGNGRPGQKWEAVLAQPAYDYALLPGFPGRIEGCHVQVTKFQGRVAHQQGRYFKYNPSDWETCFGLVPSGDAGISVDVKQWRNCGDLEYTGKVRVWAPFANDHGDNAIGRIDPWRSGSCCDFQDGDMLGHVDETNPPCCHVQVTVFRGIGRVALRNGRYFKYDSTAWETCFGPGPSGNAGIVVDVSQWQNCVDLKYTGKVKVWAPGANDHGDNAIGRIDPFNSGANDDFQNGDMLGHVGQTKPPCCLISRENKDIAKSAMYSCDASMSLLLGSSTSVGILSNIASLVNEKGSQYMPGTCCMDVPTNSQFFGYRYDPKLVNSAGTQMSCHHRGPWHLGISEEACKNAGGKWYRTPCITLQSCVENRPPRFDLEAPSGANCQDSLRRLNTAFVSTSTSLVNFTFGNSTTGCFKFCQSLPDYPLQIGMGIEGTESSASKCVCLYDNGKTPRKTLLPEYATRSPPIFFLTDATGKLALGLSQKMICASDEISVEFWKNEGSPRQKFQLTQDGRIVSVACPERVLAPAANEAGSRLVALSPQLDASETQKQNQRWIFNDESIANAASPNLKISFMAESSQKLRSFYFSLQNPKSHLNIGASSTTCQSGMKLVLQRPVFGNPGQQFYIEDHKIINLMCPRLAVSISRTEDMSVDLCGGDNELVLSNNNEASTWQLSDDGESQTIESTSCVGRFISIGHSPYSIAAAVGYITAQRRALSELPRFDNNTEGDTVNNTAIRPPTAGAAIILSNDISDQYRSWVQKHERFQYIEGLFSFVNPASGSALAVQQGRCTHGMLLETQRDDHRNLNQKFYLGRSGSILSMKCAGLAISADITEGGCGNVILGQSVKLHAYMIEEKKMKWRLNHDGNIESVKCPGLVIGSTGPSHVISLIPQDTKDSSQIWRQQNVRLLESSNNLFVRFEEPEYTVLDLQQYRWSDADRNCYPPNPAFNRAFEDFIVNNKIVIKNSADEDQCKHVREELGFDPDFPFDTEVCRKFNDFMCDPFFTGVDHVIEIFVGPPQFDQVEYEEVEYEKHEYEAPDYVEDEELPFLTINNAVAPTTVIKDQEGLQGLQKAWLVLQHALKMFQHIFDSMSFHYENCDTMPDSICVPVIMGQGGCITNPATFICKGVAFTIRAYSYVVLVGLDIAYEAVNHEFEIATLGPDDAIYGKEYSTATHTDLQSHVDWSVKSLKNINQNILNQHNSMRQHLQKRHFAMETNIGQDIFDAQNALGQAIVDAQNANGQEIVDARNAMSDQHNQMLTWMHDKFPQRICQVYQASGGDCTSFIGPLEEGQTHVPMELYWPEGQLSLMGKLQQIEETLEYGVAKMGEDGGADQAKTSNAEVKATELLKGQMKVVEEKIVAKMNVVESKMNVFESKMNAVEGKIDAVEGKVDAVRKFDALNEKMDVNMNVVEGKFNTLDGKIVSLEAIMVHLVEQNMKLMQLMKHKSMGEGDLIEDAV
eukprot:CAMPEP_0172576342 /NCGR_PEP_ID=MMETSP1067-20121228/137666_1 /TAXON_ID=265564 ORGANISM="Thalassiosira punctigera, Strain Tpunct2005C2" /NCGR_SAMPLE_ID=MMETSP1067 /ASSEMBLY_ACC=CAM_ASM_000444 /LENGTH=2652 /DNA_ID=CAMNT_0013369009 /DNA_START=2375 /DNA_END=10333 /DNA_ORIENTATION=-